MPIDPQDIERLKSGIDLAAYIASRGIALNKNGKNHKGLCPFHKEATISFFIIIFLFFVYTKKYFIYTFICYGWMENL